MTDEITRYPLTWPRGWPRTAPSNRKAARFGTGRSIYDPAKRFAPITIYQGVTRVLRELQRMNVSTDSVIISSNIPTRLDGTPMGRAAAPIDPGMAIYWKAKKVEQCLALDSYASVAENLGALAATFEALRAVERHGGGTIINRAFEGFHQLPEQVERLANWREELGFQPGQRVSAEQVQAAYRERARVLHPDGGGSGADFAKLVGARDAALKEIAP